MDRVPPHSSILTSEREASLLRGIRNTCRTFGGRPTTWQGVNPATWSGDPAPVADPLDEAAGIIQGALGGGGRVNTLRYVPERAHANGPVVSGGFAAANPYIFDVLGGGRVVSARTRKGARQSCDHLTPVPEP
jgi:hypothetical protein